MTPSKPSSEKINLPTLRDELIKHIGPKCKNHTDYVIPLTLDS
jgi:hypothetical protein